MSLEKSYSLDDESDNNWSDSGSSGTCSFPFCFGNSVGRGSSLGPPLCTNKSRVQMRLSYLYQYESITKVVNSSKCFGAKIPDFPSKFDTQFYSYSHGLTLPH